MAGAAEGDRSRRNASGGSSRSFHGGRTCPVRRCPSRCAVAWCGAAPVDVRDGNEIERAITTFAQNPNSGLIVTGSPQAASRRDLIIGLAARHRLPAVYYARYWAAAISSAARPATSIASSRVKSRPICRCKHRPSTNWLSILKPQKLSASPCRSRCSPAPTR